MHLMKYKSCQILITYMFRQHQGVFQIKDIDAQYANLATLR